MRRIFLTLAGLAIVSVAAGARAGTAAPIDLHAVSLMPRLDCVGCDACNGAGGNHETFANGGRDGVKHECFTGSTCSVHDFKSTCGGGETDDAGEPRVAVSWETVSALEGDALADFLRESQGRWVLQAEYRTIQWKDCYGNLVASIPVSVTQAQSAQTVLSELAQVN